MYLAPFGVMVLSSSLYKLNVGTMTLCYFPIGRGSLSLVHILDSLVASGFHVESVCEYILIC